MNFSLILGTYITPADEGITGTCTKKRRAFNQMMADGESGLFDFIVTKEISRFARNTLDSIFYTRKLKELGIGVFFLTDNINTLEPDSELRLTLMSGIAQEESRKTSQRVKWGQKRRMEAGVVFGHGILGYDIKNGQLTVNKKEAETVMLIFKKYLVEAKGVNTICKELEKAGYLTKNGCKKWHTSSVYKILQNEKLAGDLLQKKTYTPDYLSHVSKPNNGQEEVVFIRNHHEPIIERKTFEDVQKEMQRRKQPSRRYSSRYSFSGKIVCGLCSSVFVRKKRKKGNDTVRITWQCSRQVKYGHGPGKAEGCGNIILSEEAARRLFSEEWVRRLNEAEIDRNAVERRVCQAVTQALKGKRDNPSDELQRRLLALTDKKRGLIDLYFEKMITKEDFKEMSNKYEKQLAELKEQLLLVNNKPSVGADALSEIYVAVHSLVYLDEFNDCICRQVLDKIIVNGNGEATVLLKPL